MACEQDIIHLKTILSSLVGGSIALFGVYLTNKFQLKIQTEREKNEDKRFQSSLFFDHRRVAFAEILTRIAEINQKWLESGDDSFGPLPDDACKDLRMVFYKHQLFLDESCLDAMDLVFECYGEAIPDVCEQSTGTEGVAYRTISYLQPRLTTLFQQKIGASRDDQAFREIILLRSIRLLNQYGLVSRRETPIVPEESHLRVDLSRIGPDEAVLIAETNFSELLSKLEELNRCLTNRGHSYGVEKKVARCLVILKGPGQEMLGI